MSSSVPRDLYALKEAVDLLSELIPEWEKYPWSDDEKEELRRKNYGII